MNTKISVKVGTIEVAYEGEASFLQEGLNELLLSLSNLQAASSQLLPKTQVEDTNLQSSDQTVGKLRDNNLPEVTTNTIASAMPAESAQDLILCAMAHLQLVLRQPTNNRDDIRQEIKSATSHYNKNMSTNFSKDLKRLVDKKHILEGRKDEYSLSLDRLTTFEALLDRIK